CKLAPLAGGEVLVRGGSLLTYSEDPLRPVLLAREHSQMRVELLCRYPLLGSLNLEYLGTAIPALEPPERNQLNQDVRLALPRGPTGHLHVGARHSWEEAVLPRPWPEGMQVYVGVGLSR